MDEHWLVNIVSVAMVGLVFFVVRKMMNETSKEIAQVKKDIDEKIKKLMSIDDHKLVCRATQADMTLYISKELEKHRIILIEVIGKNRELMERLLRELRSDLKNNGYLKKGG